MTFTDKPCSSEQVIQPPTGNSPKVLGDTANSAYSSRYGDWRGQVQYQVTYKGNSVSEAHAVVPATLSIDPQGKVQGTSTENGCKMKGVASPGMSPQLLNLDVTLTGCHFQKLNRRLSGSLAVYPAEKHAQLWLYAQPVDLFNPGWSFDIKGTMRR